jgi:hypothetical protein
MTLMKLCRSRKRCFYHGYKCRSEHH